MRGVRQGVTHLEACGKLWGQRVPDQAAGEARVTGQQHHLMPRGAPEYADYGVPSTRLLQDGNHVSLYAVVGPRP